jgi:hypothetical protein
MNIVQRLLENQVRERREAAKLKPPIDITTFIDHDRNIIYNYEDTPNGMVYSARMREQPIHVRRCAVTTDIQTLNWNIIVEFSNNFAVRTTMDYNAYNNEQELLINIAQDVHRRTVGLFDIRIEDIATALAKSVQDSRYPHRR